MSRVGRGRRTRVYDCNYSKGESYYRPVLDRMDGRAPVATEPDSERVGSGAEAPAGGPFDSRGARAQRGRPLSSAFGDDGIDDEIAESLKRLRASKKAARLTDDADFEAGVADLESRVRVPDKILETAGVGRTELSGAGVALLEDELRTEKRIARRLNGDGALTKWTALKGGDEEAAAAQRARATRARLADLEDEMNVLSERSAARESRAARLRALVADAGGAGSTLAASNIAIRAEREKRQVTF